MLDEPHRQRHRRDEGQGTLRLSTRVEDGCIVVDVSDSGHGIANSGVQDACVRAVLHDKGYARAPAWGPTSPGASSSNATAARSPSTRTRQNHRPRPHPDLPLTRRAIIAGLTGGACFHCGTSGTATKGAPGAAEDRTALAAAFASCSDGPRRYTGRSTGLLRPPVLHTPENSDRHELEGCWSIGEADAVASSNPTASPASRGQGRLGDRGTCPRLRNATSMSRQCHIESTAIQTLPDDGGCVRRAIFLRRHPTASLPPQQPETDRGSLAPLTALTCWAAQVPSMTGRIRPPLPRPLAIWPPRSGDHSSSASPEGHRRPAPPVDRPLYSAADVDSEETQRRGYTTAQHDQQPEICPSLGPRTACCARSVIGPTACGNARDEHRPEEAELTGMPAAS